MSRRALYPDEITQQIQIERDKLSEALRHNALANQRALSTLPPEPGDTEDEVEPDTAPEEEDT